MLIYLQKMVFLFLFHFKNIFDGVRIIFLVNIFLILFFNPRVD